MQKKVLLLCANYNDFGTIKSLRKLGYYIILTGNVAWQCGQKYVDRHVMLDYSDMDGVARLAKDEKVDAICQGCNDYTVHTAAYVAEKLGLPGYDSFEITRTLNEKAAF